MTTYAYKIQEDGTAGPTDIEIPVATVLHQCIHLHDNSLLESVELHIDEPSEISSDEYLFSYYHIREIFIVSFAITLMSFSIYYIYLCLN